MISPLANLRVVKAGAGSLALIALAMVAAPTAAADGVIVKSTSIDYPVGVLVKDGDVLRLSAGQTVTILDRSGVVIERKTGAYAGPTAREAKGLAEVAATIAAGPQAKSAIGGVRHDEKDCNLATAAATDACTPQGIVGKRLRIAGYTPARPGVAGKLVLQSNFDGYAICVGWNNPSEDSRFLAVGDPAHPVELSGSEPARLKLASAGSGAAMKSISCAGFSAEVWNLLRLQGVKALDANSATNVLSNFAKLQGETIAEGRATASAKP